MKRKLINTLALHLRDSSTAFSDVTYFRRFLVVFLSARPNSISEDAQPLHSDKFTHFGPVFVFDTLLSQWDFE